MAGVKTALERVGADGQAGGEMDAVPPVTVTGVPMSVVPYSNCTVPGADGVTVAFRVTEVPDTCGRSAWW